MKKNLLLSVLLVIGFQSCKEPLDVHPTPDKFPESTTSVDGEAVIKVLPHSLGWVSLGETLQPQYRVTQPKRWVRWYDVGFHETSSYLPPEGWSLIDATVHPSGQVSVALVNLDIKRDPMLKIKIIRLENGSTLQELSLQPLPVPEGAVKFFPASLDRIRLEAYHEDVYVVARWDYNEVTASRFSYSNHGFNLKWQTLVEPEAYAGSIGIIGGGFDNFHQGDRYFFVHAGVDSRGNLFVAVASHEDLLLSHDARFNDNLVSKADPGNYDWGVAVLTKLSPTGERKYARLTGMSTQKRLVNMRVGEEEVYLIGRVKTGVEPGSWDSWLLAADANSGVTKYERQIHIQEGDMFWDVLPLEDGSLVAVGTKAYTQNPAGLSVSNSRLAMALVVNPEGAIENEIDVPQGPAARGSEAMFVKLVGNNSILFCGVHNAPGTHADVYCDGFIAVRKFSVE